MYSPRDDLSVPIADERVLGCFLGGALGDAMGERIEFMRLDEIRSIYRKRGDGLLPIGGITDDTQMTLWTAEGMIRAQQARLLDDSDIDPIPFVHRAYQRWMLTQKEHIEDDADPGRPLRSGWLIDEPGLWKRMAPGMTCLSSLRTGVIGMPAVNDSKGCGAVMRVAPLGFIPGVSPYRLGNAVAEITHGHPTSSYAAGALVHLIRQLDRNNPLPEAVGQVIAALEAEPAASEVTSALWRARHLALLKRPTAEKVESLGQGWVAEEALSIAVYCALVAEDFYHGANLAVEHSGDSDSTGSITGQILGTLWGIGGVPAPGIEESVTVVGVAEDFFESAVCGQPLDLDRYPAC